MILRNGIMKPPVTVVIPYYNRPSELEAALASVLAQSWTAWDVVVVDDASAIDPTAIVRRVVGEERGRVVRHHVNRGPSAARNTGTQSARGDFVAYLDSDDAWHPQKLEAQMKAVMALADPAKAFCVTKTNVVSGKAPARLLPTRPLNRGEDFAEFLYVHHGFAQTSSFLLHRSEALSIGFPEELRQYEDHLFFIRAGARGLTYVLVEEPLVTWNNDDRAGRLGSSDNLNRGEQFLKLASAIMPERAVLAFRTRYLGELLFSANPREAFAIFHSAFRTGAVGLRDLAVLATKCALPRPAFQILRRSFAK